MNAGPTKEGEKFPTGKLGGLTRPLPSVPDIHSLGPWRTESPPSHLPAPFPSCLAPDAGPPEWLLAELFSRAAPSWAPSPAV